MDENKKMREAIRKTFEAIYGQTGELKSDFDKLRILEHAIISNLGEFREKPEPEIVPAEPLIEPLEEDQLYYHSLGETPSVIRWYNHTIDHFNLQDKNVFPFTPEGKAGAELRAKVPHPGLHWQEDLKKLRDARSRWVNAPITDKDANSIFSAASHTFISKYMNEK